MQKPLSLVVLGVLMYVIGFALGSNDIDPASAILATTGAAIVLVGLAWVAVSAVRGRTG